MLKTVMFTTAPEDMDEEYAANHGPTAMFTENILREVQIHANNPNDLRTRLKTQTELYEQAGWATMDVALLTHALDLGYCRLLEGRCNRCYGLIIGPTFVDPDTALPICKNCRLLES